MEYIENKFLYFGLFLTSEDKTKLSSYIDNIVLEKIYLDHLTLLFKTDVNSDKGKTILKYMSFIEPNDTHFLTIDGIGFSDRAVAFRVKQTAWLEKYCMNAQPHITIGTRNGGKPVESNNIINWQDIPEITIKPVFKIINKK